MRVHLRSEIIIARYTCSRHNRIFARPRVARGDTVNGVRADSRVNFVSSISDPV